MSAESYIAGAGSFYTEPDPYRNSRGYRLSTDNYEAEQRAVAAELERLRSIVRDLAASNPIHDDDWGQVWCAVCSEPSAEHDPGCPWLRATQEAKP